MSRLPVPYVTAYDGESIAYQLALTPHAGTTDGIRLTYVDSVETDWMFGVLWHRHGMSRFGRPLWRLVNTARQRRCMLRRLCQVCGQSAEEDGRIWWVMPDPPATTSVGQPFTHVPPTCPACIRKSRLLCPRLRPKSHVYTTRDCDPYGVVADIYRPAAGRTVIVVQRAVELPLEAFRDLEYALATQLIVTLNGLQELQMDECDLVTDVVGSP
jgi:hypothetical protein